MSKKTRLEIPSEHPDRVPIIIEVEDRHVNIIGALSVTAEIPIRKSQNGILFSTSLPGEQESLIVNVSAKQSLAFISTSTRLMLAQNDKLPIMVAQISSDGSCGILLESDQGLPLSTMPLMYGR